MFLCDRGRFGYEFVNAPERERSARIAGRPAPVDAQGGRALDAAAALLCDRRVIGIGSPRASLEDNFALRTLVGADRFYLGMSATDRDLVGEVLDIARGGLHLSSLRDVHDAGAVVVLGEDLTDTAPMLDLTLRTWLRLRPTAEEERVHIRRWNDAAVGRAKRREPSVLWVATTHATKLDEVAAESWHAAPDDIARHALALAHELDGGPPDVPGLDADEGERVARWAAALRGHPAPLVVSGTSSGSPAVLGAAARLARALATAGAEDPVAALSPRVLLTVPEANSLGLAMMGGGGLPEAVAAAARGEADTVVVLGDDLYRRAAPLLVDDLLRPGRGVVVLASLFDKVTARADVALPTTTVAESSGTFVNNEGRAQRFFAVLPPGDGMRDGWRWARDLARLSGRSDQADWETLDDVIAALERDLPQFRGLSAAAPGAGWRLRDRVVARQPLRWSGRTAADADLTLREPAPAADPDSALAFSLEGLAPSEAPAALLPRVWSPGWNSWNGLHKLQEEVNGPLRDGPTGVRLLDGPVETRPASTRARLPSGADGPRRFVARLDEFLLVPAHHIFGSDDLSMRSPGIAARAPQPYIGVNDADAARLGLVPGDHLALWLPWLDLRAAYRPMPSLPDGVAALPVGLPGRPYVSLPARGRLTRIAGPKATS
jgi:NADH-quinone oxidoreductase subunit G